MHLIDCLVSLDCTSMAINKVQRPQTLESTNMPRHMRTDAVLPCNAVDLLRSLSSTEVTPNMYAVTHNASA